MEFETEGLPEGWTKTNLENCINILDSKRVPINSNERSKRYGSIPYYGATGQIGWIDDYLFNETLVLLGEDGAPFLETFKDKAYIIYGKSWVNNHAHVLQGMSNILLNKFLMYFLNQFNYKDYVTGTTRLKLNQTRMKDIPILFPPLPEQHRIVSKLESIFGRIDACREKLEKLVQQTKSASGSLSQLKSSILKQAFEGKLVPQDPNDEPAEMLLRRLHDGSDNKLEFETEGLPDGWIKTLLTNIVTNDKYAIKRGPFGSHLRKEFFKESGFKVYEQQNAINNNFDIGNYYIDEKKFQQLKAFELKRGDLIISCSGTIGKIAIVPDNFQKGIINQALLKITINTNIFLIPFFIHFFNFWKMNEGIKSQGSGMQNLASVKVLKKIPILFPPLPEQRRIVSKLESIFERIDAIVIYVKEALRTLDMLKQSVLKQAFEGKLVPQDPNDEPASVLLEKIRQKK